MALLSSELIQKVIRMLQYSTPDKAINLLLGEIGTSADEQEAIEDIVGDMFTGNTETLITSSYDDTNGKITLTVSVDADDIDDSGTTNKFATSGQLAKIDFLTVTQAVDLDAIETRVNALDAAVILQGSWDASVGTFPGGGTAQAGDSYIVSTGGTVDSVVFTANDRIVAITDNASTSTYASNWLKLDYTDQVLSVAGKTGAVVLAASDIASGTFTDARISESSVTQHTDAILKNSKLHINTTAVGNVGTGEDDLMSYTMPANTLSANGYGIRVTAWGDAPDNAGTKTLKTYFGTQIVATDDIKANQIDQWKVVYTVWRDSAGNQTYESEFLLSGTATDLVLEHGTSTQDETGTLVIKCTGEGTNNDDIVQRGLVVEFIP